MIGHGIELNLSFRKSENNIARPHSQARGHDGKCLIGFHSLLFSFSGMSYNRD